MNDIKIELSEKLQAFSEVITSEDRKDAENSLPISRPTMDKYLAGDIVKLDTAIELINFLSKKLSNRVASMREANLI